MRIGELAQRSGVAVETIRFYEAQGLLPAPLRLENNYRNYTRRHLARLHFIRHCRLLDMSLEEIAKLANLENAQPCEFGVVHETIGAHIRDIDNRIQELMYFRLRISSSVVSACRRLSATVREITKERVAAFCRSWSPTPIPATAVGSLSSTAVADIRITKSGNTSGR